jgi:hypothetical protein
VSAVRFRPWAPSFLPSGPAIFIKAAALLPKRVGSKGNAMLTNIIVGWIVVGAAYFVLKRERDALVKRIEALERKVFER